MNSKRIIFILTILLILGVASFFTGHLLYEPGRVWQVYLVNFSFWTALAQGGVVFSAAYRLSGARWGDSFRRIGESFAGFLPISILLLIVLLVYKQELYVWVDEPPVKKTAWLNPSFFTIRLLCYYSFVTLLSILYVYNSRMEENGTVDIDQYRRKRTIIAPILVTAFVIGYTYTGFDLIMSLDPTWYSTIYGWLYVLYGFYSALVFMVIVGFVLRRFIPFGEQLKSKQFHDLGNLILGFCMLSGGLLWSQYLTIWYGNLPDEIGHVITRFHLKPWSILSTIMIITVFIGPMVVLFSKSVKRNPLFLFLLCLIVILGIWLNQFLEVVPSVWDHSYIPLGFVELGVSAGFLSLFGFSLLWTVRKILFVR